MIKDSKKQSEKIEKNTVFIPAFPLGFCQFSLAYVLERGSQHIS